MSSVPPHDLFSLHKLPLPAQISMFNSLSFALVPGARIIDYVPSIQSPPPFTVIDDTKTYISTYSSLATALDEQAS